MKAFFGEPVVRLFLRALLVAAVAFATKFIVFDPTGNTVSYQTAALGAAATSAVLAFCEVFTPLNGLVGVLKLPFPPQKSGFAVTSTATSNVKSLPKQTPRRATPKKP